MLHYFVLFDRAELQVVGLQYDLAVAAVRVFNLVCLILLIGHWNGCLQFLVPMLNDFPDDSWIVVDKLMVINYCLFFTVA